LDFPRPLLALSPGSVGTHLPACVAAGYLVGPGTVYSVRIGIVKLQRLTLPRSTPPT